MDGSTQLIPGPVSGPAGTVPDYARDVLLALACRAELERGREFDWLRLTGRPDRVGVVSAAADRLVELGLAEWDTDARRRVIALATPAGAVRAVDHLVERHAPLIGAAADPRPADPAELWRLTLRPVADPLARDFGTDRPAHYRVRLALKVLLRSFGLRCVMIGHPPDAPPPAKETG